MGAITSLGIFPNLQSSVEKIYFKELEEFEIELFIKREDLLHPFISGNKYRKLNYNLAQAKLENKTQLLTFGGAFSNHILAVANAGKTYGFETIGLIRGEELQYKKRNATLQKAETFGMQFHFISRKAYQQKHTADFLKKIQNQFPNAYCIPEGGANDLGVKGCEEILNEQDFKYDFIAVPIGTGGTFLGLLNSIQKHQKVLGFSALKMSEKEFLNAVNISKKNNYDFFSEENFGGYGKFNSDLITFINRFKKQTQILLDPIYTGKMMFSLFQKIKQNDFQKGQKILVIHTGGLQGIAGVNHILQKRNQKIIEV